MAACFRLYLEPWSGFVHLPSCLLFAGYGQLKRILPGPSKPVTLRMVHGQVLWLSSVPQVRELIVCLRIITLVVCSFSIASAEHMGLHAPEQAFTATPSPHLVCSLTRASIPCLCPKWNNVGSSVKVWFGGFYSYFIFFNGKDDRSARLI